MDRKTDTCHCSTESMAADAATCDEAKYDAKFYSHRGDAADQLLLSYTSLLRVTIYATPHSKVLGEPNRALNMYVGELLS